MHLQAFSSGCQSVLGRGVSQSGLRNPTAAVHAQQHLTRKRCCITRAAQQNAAGEDFGESVKRIAKKIQGSLPIIGLLSRLAAPEGGFDEIAYPEFCRTAFDTADDRFRIAATELEKKYGKMGRTRWTLLVLWMAKYGVGLVPNKELITAARRIRVSQDIEIEIGRFDETRNQVIKKYSIMERPKGTLSNQVAVACDALCTLCLGLKDGAAVDAADEQLLVDTIRYAFPEASDDMLLQTVQDRPKRASSYS